MASLDPAVLDRLRERLAARPEILEAYYFGSQARGDAGAGSDLDIAVYGVIAAGLPEGHLTSIARAVLAAEELEVIP